MTYLNSCYLPAPLFPENGKTHWWIPAPLLLHGAWGWSDGRLCSGVQWLLLPSCALCHGACAKHTCTILSVVKWQEWWGGYTLCRSLSSGWALCFVRMGSLFCQDGLFVDSLFQRRDCLAVSKILGEADAWLVRLGKAGCWPIHAKHGFLRCDESSWSRKCVTRTQMLCWQHIMLIICWPGLISFWRLRLALNEGTRRPCSLAPCMCMISMETYLICGTPGCLPTLGPTTVIWCLLCFDRMWPQGVRSLKRSSKPTWQS